MNILSRPIHGTPHTVHPIDRPIKKMSRHTERATIEGNLHTIGIIMISLESPGKGGVTMEVVRMYKKENIIQEIGIQGQVGMVKISFRRIRREKDHVMSLTKPESTNQTTQKSSVHAHATRSTSASMTHRPPTKNPPIRKMHNTNK